MATSELDTTERVKNIGECDQGKDESTMLGILPE